MFGDPFLRSEICELRTKCFALEQKVIEQSKVINNLTEIVKEQTIELDDFRAEVADYQKFNNEALLLIFEATLGRKNPDWNRLSKLYGELKSRN